MKYQITCSFCGFENVYEVEDDYIRKFKGFGNAPTIEIKMYKKIFICEKCGEILED